MAYLALSSSGQHRNSRAHSLVGLLALALLGLRIIWALGLAVLASLDWRHYHAPAVLELPTVHELMAGAAKRPSAPQKRDTASARVWLLLGLLPLNVELLQWVPWRSAPHDGLPNHGLLAMSAALSLSHGVALLLLQGWFLATAGVATTEYVRASALGMALALSVGALCRVGLRRAGILLRAATAPAGGEGGKKSSSVFWRHQQQLVGDQRQRTRRQHQAAAPAAADSSERSSNSEPTTPPRLISTLANKSDRAAARQWAEERQAAARARVVGSPEKPRTKTPANAGALQRARARVQKMAEEEARRLREEALWGGEVGVAAREANNSSALARARAAKRWQAAASMQAADAGDEVDALSLHTPPKSSSVRRQPAPLAEEDERAQAEEVAADQQESTPDASASGSAALPSSTEVEGEVSSCSASSEDTPEEEGEDATDAAAAAPASTEPGSTSTEPAAFVDSGLDVDASVSARVERAKSGNVEKRVTMRLARARVVNEEVREREEERAAQQQTVAERIRAAEQWRPAGLAPAAAPAAAEGVESSTAGCSAAHRLQLARASNRIRRSRAIFEGGDLPVDDDEEGGAGKAQQNV